MRLVGLALSAALLSGCSFFGPSGSSTSHPEGPYGSAQHGTYGTGYADPCQIPHVQAPVPQGCHPSQVTIGVPAHAGGFPQQPQFGQPVYGTSQYTSGGYGTHASGNVHSGHHPGANAPQIRRPRFRAALDLGLEQSLSGNALDSRQFVTDPFANYDPADYNEGTVTGSPADGEVVITDYFVDSRLRNTADPWDEERVPDVSFKDAWSTPVTLGASGEFILNDKATLFARAGYTRAEGTNGGAATIEGTVFEGTTRIQFEENDAGAMVEVGRISSTAFVTEQPITEISYDFSDLERIDLEAGGRFYFDPVAGRATGQTVTPFLGASAGASHLNAASYTLDQRQLGYASVFEDGDNEYYDLDRPEGFDLDNDPTTASVTRVDLYDSQWVPTGRLSAGVEWQVTPKTALAFETGLRVQGARDYSNGAKGDTQISVPVTLRGSFNF